MTFRSPSWGRCQNCRKIGSPRDRAGVGPEGLYQVQYPSRGSRWSVLGLGPSVKQPPSLRSEISEICGARRAIRLSHARSRRPEQVSFHKSGSFLQTDVFRHCSSFGCRVLLGHYMKKRRVDNPENGPGRRKIPPCQCLACVSDFQGVTGLVLFFFLSSMCTPRRYETTQTCNFWEDTRNDLPLPKTLP